MVPLGSGSDLGLSKGTAPLTGSDSDDSLILALTLIGHRGSCFIAVRHTLLNPGILAIFEIITSLRGKVLGSGGELDGGGNSGGGN